MPEITLQQALDLALQHHQAGRLAEAENLYRLILAQQPNHAEAMRLLGVIANQVGRNEIAIDLIRRAISLSPSVPQAYSNLGNALKDAGRLDDAVAAYRQAIALSPDYIDAYSNLGVALTISGDVVQAIAVFRRAIALQPDYADAYNNLGIALVSGGQLDDGISAYRRAIALKPDYADAYNNLGNALKDKGLIEDAIAAHRRAIELRPSYAQAHCNLGIALSSAGRSEEAQAAYRQAIALRPTYAEAHNNLGKAFKEIGRFDEAIAAYKQAIELRPSYDEAHSNLGNALKDSGQVEGAMASLRHAIALNPSRPETHSNLLYTLQYQPGLDVGTIADEHRRWNHLHAEPLGRVIGAHTNDRDPDRRLRIGYISPDFRDHVVGRNILPLMREHDRSRFETTCYCQVSTPDALTGEFQQSASRWRDIVGLSDEQLAEQIRRDSIDILVDLTLHMARNRLLVMARKPAPVQVTFAGYPGTTGLSSIGYRLSDPYLDPAGMDESIYSEQTVRLPDTFWCYDPLEFRDTPVNSLPAIGNRVVTFGCLNNFCKVNGDVLALWAKVLRQVEASRLLVLSPAGSHRRRTLERLSQEGVDSSRVEFVALQPRQQYLETYHRMDLGLDTFPYNGHTTSLESLWMGVPVVTFIGKTAPGRAGLSQLSNLGLAELAGQTPADFVRIAVDLAGDLPRLAQLRSTLRSRMEQSPMMDSARFARNIEAAYRRMWRTWCESAPT